MDKPTLHIAPVVILPVITRLDIESKRVLQGAIDAELSQAIVIGYDKNGEFYFASTKADGPNVLWDLEKAKQALLNVVVPI